MKKNKIYKYGPIPFYPHFQKVPGRWVHAGIQGSSLYVWAEICDDNVDSNQAISVVPTGIEYVGKQRFTVLEENFVWHVVSSDIDKMKQVKGFALQI